MTTAPRHAGGDWTPADVAAMVANPFYAIEIDPALGAVESAVSDEEWVDANATALTRNPKRWLHILLRVLHGEEFPEDTPESALATLANPGAQSRFTRCSCSRTRRSSTRPSGSPRT